MNFLQRHFKTTFYRLPLSNRGIYLQIIHVRRKAIFLCFTARASCALTISHFKLNILDSESPHTKNGKYCAIYNKVMQYTVLNNGCLNSVQPKTPVPRINRQQVIRIIFKGTVLT